MSKKNIMRLLGLVVIASMVLTACGGGAEPAATEPAASGPKVTSSGFECPEPSSARGSHIQRIEYLCVD